MKQKKSKATFETTASDNQTIFIFDNIEHKQLPAKIHNASNCYLIKINSSKICACFVNSKRMGSIDGRHRKAITI